MCIMVGDADVKRDTCRVVTQLASHATGNGTESMFYSDPSVMCISIHRYDNGSFYPRSGHPCSCGQGAGLGYNINIALDGKGYGDSDYLTIFDKVAMPVARAFNPDIVLVSCGFDACRGDPLGEFDVTASGYARMTQRLMSLADGKCVSALFWLYFSVVCHTFPFPSF